MGLFTEFAKFPHHSNNSYRIILIYQKIRDMVFNSAL